MAWGAVLPPPNRLSLQTFSLALVQESTARTGTIIRGIFSFIDTLAYQCIMAVSARFEPDQIASRSTKWPVVVEDRLYVREVPHLLFWPWYLAGVVPSCDCVPLVVQICVGVISPIGLDLSVKGGSNVAAVGNLVLSTSPLVLMIRCISRAVPLEMTIGCAGTAYIMWSSER